MAGESLFQNQRAPYLTVDETASASVTTPPDTGDTRIFIDSADGVLKLKDDAGSVTTVGDSAAAALITTHEGDTTSAHTAEGVDVVDAGALLAATNVEAALAEIQGNVDTDEAALVTHLSADDHTQYIKDAEFTAADTVLLGTGAGTFAELQHGFSKTTAPGVSDDNTAGWAVGSNWIDTTGDTMYVALDVTTGAAVWQEVGAGGGGGAALTVTDESGTVSDTAVTSITVPDGTLVDNGTGDVTLREVPAGVIGAKLTHTTGTSIPTSTETAVDFDTEDFDTDGFHEGVTNPERLTVPAGLAGKYLVIAQGRLDNLDDGEFVDVRIRVNGTRETLVRYYSPAVTQVLTGGASVIVDLAVGDYVDLALFQDSGGALTTGVTDTFLSMHKLGSGTVGEAIGASAYENGTQALTASTSTVVALDSVDWDTDGFLDAANDQLTVPAGLAGKYLVRGYVNFNASAGDDVMIWIEKNTVQMQAVQQAEATGVGEGRMVITAILDLAVGDDIRMKMRDQDSSPTTGDASTRGEQNSLEMVLLATQGSGGGSALTLTDESGTVSDAAVTSITVPDGTLVDNGTGDVTLREVPTGVVGARVTKSSDQTNITDSTIVKVTFDTTDFDTDSLFDDANDQFTIPAGLGGTYLVVGTVRLEGIANTTTDIQSYLRKNQSASDRQVIYRNNVSTADPANLAWSGSWIVDLAAGDDVDVVVYVAGTGGTSDVISGADFTSLQLVKLGSGTVGEAIGAKAYNSAVQSVANTTFTALTLDSEEFDTDGFHSTSTNTARLTVPAGLGGKYLVIGRSQFAASATGERILKVRKNGSTDVSGRWGSSDPSASSSEYVSGSEVVDLAAGDYIELMAYQGSGGAQNVGGTAAESRTHFSMHLLATQGARSGPELLDYTEFTAGGNITATVEASADTVVTATAETFDGSTPAIIEFYAPNARPDTGAASRTLNVFLFEDGSSIGQMALIAAPAAGGANASILVRRRLTPASGSRTYSIRATVNVGTGVITAGTGGSGNQMPGYIRIVTDPA